MSKGNILTGIVFLVLSVVVTYGVAILDSSIRNSFLAGEAGFPFRFSSASLFASESTNQIMLFLDIIFWFVILFGAWKLILKLIKK